jgi:selenocysteine lyase/cysteine desulfurase
MRRGRRTTRTEFVRGRSLSAGIAGTLAAVNFLAGIGQLYGSGYQDRFPGFSGRRLDLKTGMTVLRQYDHVLSAAILDELETLPGVRIHGITDRARLEERVSTVSFTWEDGPRGHGPRRHVTRICRLVSSMVYCVYRWFLQEPRHMVYWDVMQCKQTLFACAGICG